MMPLHLFQSRTFTLANILTLLLLCRARVILFLVPLNLIQIQHYTATEAGAAFLPFPVVMFAMSGGRVASSPASAADCRLPRAAIAALGGVVCAARNRRLVLDDVFPRRGRAWIGDGDHCCAVDDDGHGSGGRSPRRRGVGVNNAVARVAGLLAIAVFGVVLARTFEARVRPSVDGLGLSASTTSAIDRELPKMAGADLDAVSSIEPAQRAALRHAIDQSFASAFRFVILVAAALALAAAAAGAAIR